MKKQIVLLAFLSVLILVVGCEEITTTTTTTTTVPRGSKEYYPTTDGYSFTYQRKLSAWPFEGFYIATWEGMTTVEGIDVHKLSEVQSQNGSVYTSESLFRVTEYGVRNYGTTSYPTTEGYVLLDFPLEVGKSWYWYSGLTDEAIVRTIETVTVPAGSFSCFKVDYNWYVLSPWQTYWFAKDVGIVKRVWYYDLYSMRIATDELTSKNF